MFVSNVDRYSKTKGESFAILEQLLKMKITFLARFVSIFVHVSKSSQEWSQMTFLLCYNGIDFAQINPNLVNALH